MKCTVVCADPPWNFLDEIKMDSVKRGASSQYELMSNKDIIDLDVKSISADDAILALWVPSSLLQIGLDTMKAWGFEQKQTVCWIKTKQKPLDSLLQGIKKIKSLPDVLEFIKNGVNNFNMNDTLYFGMGRLFRNTHEIVLIGTRGKIYQHLKNKSQRTVHFAPIGKHSKKPELLQDMLDTMFPDTTLNRVELFARRPRKGWLTYGNECSASLGQDIRDSIKEIENLP